MRRPRPFAFRSFSTSPGSQSFRQLGLEVSNADLTPTDLTDADYQYVERLEQEIVAARHGQGCYISGIDEIANAVVSPQRISSTSIPKETWKETEEHATFVDLIASFLEGAVESEGDDADRELVGGESEEEISEDQYRISGNAVADFYVEDASDTDDEGVRRESDAESWLHLNVEGLEFEEPAGRQEFRQVEFAQVSHYERALQIALPIALAEGWDQRGLALLAQIFERYRWNAAKRAIERELANGLTVQELRLAFEVRQIWEEHPEFAGTSVPGGYLVSTLTWPAALRLVRAFPGLPDVVEIQQLLVLLHDEWYASDSLHRQFPRFVQFVQLRCGYIDPWVRDESALETVRRRSDDDRDVLTEIDRDELEQLGICVSAFPFAAREIWIRVENYQEIEDELNPGAAALRRSEAEAEEI